MCTSFHNAQPLNVGTGIDIYLGYAHIPRSVGEFQYTMRKFEKFLEINFIVYFSFYTFNKRCSVGRHKRKKKIPLAMKFFIPSFCFGFDF